MTEIEIAHKNTCDVANIDLNPQCLISVEFTVECYYKPSPVFFYFVRINLLLALIVTGATIFRLILPASALTRKERVLECHYSVHTHDASCYEQGINGEDHTGDPAYLVCGKMELLKHVHGDDCFIEKTVEVDEGENQKIENINNSSAIKKDDITEEPIKDDNSF